MKKTIALLTMILIVKSVYSQDITSKKGEPILPEAGDYMIGIELNPFLNYISHGVSPTFNFMNGNNMIIGKYYKNAKTAYRVGFRLGIDNQTTKKQLVDQSATFASVYPNLPFMSDDKMTHNKTNIGLTFGIEKRKGKTRLQGFYGADIMFWTSSLKDSYSYGQTIDPVSSIASLQTINAANTSDFGSNSSVTNPSINLAGAASARTISSRTGNGFGVGVRAFIGAEYFILPKISIGGEFGWGIGYMSGGKTTTVIEATGNNGSTNTKDNITKTVKNGGHFVVDTDLNNTSTGSLLAPSGSLRLNLHF
jgi:hypothetical protein